MKSEPKAPRLKTDLRLREGGAEFTYDVTMPFSNATIKYKGETLSLKDWSAKLGANYSLVRDRLVSGWTIAEAVTAVKGARRTEDSKYTSVIVAILPGVATKE